MYLFVKPTTDITTNGEVLISLSIVAINIAFFFYAALLLYRSFKEFAEETLYTTGETEAEKLRIQARLDAMTDEQREMIERIEQQRGAANGQKLQHHPFDMRRSSIVGGADSNEGGIEMPNRRRASMTMFGGNPIPISNDFASQSENSSLPIATAHSMQLASLAGSNHVQISAPQSGGLISLIVESTEPLGHNDSKIEDVYSKSSQVLQKQHHHAHHQQLQQNEEAQRKQQQNQLSRDQQDQQLKINHSNIVRYDDQMPMLSSKSTAADITAHMLDLAATTTAPLASPTERTMLSVELQPLMTASPSASLAIESGVRVYHAQPVTTHHNGSVRQLPSIAVDRDGCISVETALAQACPLDLIAFVGAAEACSNPLSRPRWTHVGAVVNTELLGSIVNGRPGELYVLEAAPESAVDSSGDDEPCSVETGSPADGVQIRSLREVCNLTG